MNVFQFMGSGSSSERPTQHIARKVAEDIMNTKKNKGKIVLVGGPAIVHTGAADAVAKMIKTGHINAVLAGNALAVHLSLIHISEPTRPLYISYAVLHLSLIHI